MIMHNNKVLILTLPWNTWNLVNQNVVMNMSLSFGVSRANVAVRRSETRDPLWLGMSLQDPPAAPISGTDWSICHLQLLSHSNNGWPGLILRWRMEDGPVWLRNKQTLTGSPLIAATVAETSAQVIISMMSGIVCKYCVVAVGAVSQWGALQDQIQINCRHIIGSLGCNVCIYNFSASLVWISRLSMLLVQAWSGVETGDWLADVCVLIQDGVRGGWAWWWVISVHAR